MLDAGAHARMRRYAAQAIARARRYDRYGLATAYRTLARAAALAPDAAAPPEPYLARALAAAQARESAHEIALTQLCMAEIAAGREADRRAALAPLDQATRGFEAMRMAWHL